MEGNCKRQSSWSLMIYIQYVVPNTTSPLFSAQAEASFFSDSSKTSGHGIATERTLPCATSHESGSRKSNDSSLSLLRTTISSRNASGTGPSYGNRSNHCSRLKEGRHERREGRQSRAHGKNSRAVDSVCLDRESLSETRGPSRAWRQHHRNIDFEKQTLVDCCFDNVEERGKPAPLLQLPRAQRDTGPVCKMDNRKPFGSRLSFRAAAQWKNISDRSRFNQPVLIGP